jgi:type IV pilus assembly protein PilW
MRLAADVTNPGDNTTVQVVEPNELKDGPDPGQLEENLAVITDCSKADLFQITSSNPRAGNWARECGSTNVATSINRTPCAGGNVPLVPLSTDGYAESNTIVRVIRQDTFRVQELTDGPNLARERNRFFPNNNNQGIIPNIVDMQVFYGIGGADGVADSYVPAGGVGDFNTVVSLRIFLLVRSRDDNVVDQPQTLRYIDASSTNQDLAPLTMPTRHFYRVVVHTISLRERV